MPGLGRSSAERQRSSAAWGAVAVDLLRAFQFAPDDVPVVRGVHRGAGRQRDVAARLAHAGFLRDGLEDVHVELRGLRQRLVDLVDVPGVLGLEDDRVAGLQLVDVVELRAVPVAVRGQCEVALLVLREGGLYRVGVVAGDAVVQDAGGGALLDQDLAVVHGRHVQEADAVLGVEGAGAVGPAVADLGAVLVGRAVGEDVGPPQRVDDEESEHQTRCDEEFAEDADDPGDPVARACH